MFHTPYIHLMKIEEVKKPYLLKYFPSLLVPLITKSDVNHIKFYSVIHIIGQCKMQIADYCFHPANKYMTTIIPLFYNPKKNSPQSAFYSAHYNIMHIPIKCNK